MTGFRFAKMGVPKLKNRNSFSKYRLSELFKIRSDTRTLFFLLLFTLTLSFGELVLLNVARLAQAVGLARLVIWRPGFHFPFLLRLAWLCRSHAYRFDH